jgi:hypothetical protein
VSLVVLLFLLLVALADDLEDVAVLDLHLHLLFLSPGTSALNTCVSGVSESEAVRGKRLPLLPEPKGKPWKGSQRSSEKGSNTLLRLISDIV